MVYSCPLTELPESVGDLHALEKLTIMDCDQFTTIPESVGDLICRKARGEEGSAFEATFSWCPKLVLSPEIQHALQILERGVY